MERTDEIRAMDVLPGKARDSYTCEKGGHEYTVVGI